MVFRVCALLVLLSLAGVGWCETVYIKDATTSESKGSPGIFTYILNNGVKSSNSKGGFYEGKASSFGCVKKGDHAFIEISYDVKIPKAFSLNMAKDFGDFTKHNGNEGEVTIDDWTRDICFFQGIWNPSKPAASEVYFNILKNNSGFDGTNVLFLRAEFTNQDFSLRITKSHKKFSLKNYLNDGQPDREKKIVIQGETTSKLITEASYEGRLILGNLEGKLQQASGIKIELGVQKIVIEKDGEFHMAFFTENIHKNHEKKAAIDFALAGTTESIRTKWVEAEKTGEGVKITPSQNGLDLLEGNKDKSYFII